MLKRSNSGRHSNAGTRPGGRVADNGFESFFRNEYLPVVRFVRRAGATTAEAEDAASTAMVAAYRSWAALNNPRAWVRTSALRLYIRQLERNRVDVARAIRALAAPRYEHDRDPGEHSRVVAILRALPPAQLEVMALIFDGYTPAEIAELLDKSPATVRSNLRQARRRLEHLLERSGNQPTRAEPAHRQGSDRGNGGRYDF